MCNLTPESNLKNFEKTNKKKMNFKYKFESKEHKMMSLKNLYLFHAFQCIHVKDAARELKVARILHGVSRVALNNRYM